MYEKKGFKIRDADIQKELAIANICFVYGMSFKEASKLPIKEFIKKSIIAEYVKRVF